MVSKFLLFAISTDKGISFLAAKHTIEDVIETYLASMNSSFD